MAASPPSRRRFAFAISCVVVIGLVLRCLVVVKQFDQLTQDRDVYLGIAVGISDGRGFCTPNSSRPTAFRPPLYPLTLAAGLTLLSPPMVVATVNILSGLMTIWLTASIGAALNLRWRGIIAALLVAVDPLLCVYTSQPMTESICTMLAALWLWTLIHQWRDRGQKFPADALLAGIAFGLMVLCRPTFWPIAAIYGLICSSTFLQSVRQTDRTQLKRHLRWSVVCILTTGAMIVPWVARNWLVLGTPILTTTHGGYTLLLSNNPVFYQEVVNQPWGTVWGGESLAKWQAETESQIELDLGNSASEVDRDRWLSLAARRVIIANPRLFRESVLHRVRSLWNIVPQGDFASRIGPATTFAVGAFYGVTLICALIGLITVLLSSHRSRWMPLYVLIICVQCVHLFYWTNTRMRAPLTPAIALLAAASIPRRTNSAH